MGVIHFMTPEQVMNITDNLIVFSFNPDNELVNHYDELLNRYYRILNSVNE